MQCAVRPVMPCIFDNKEEGNLIGHLEKGGERDAGCEAKVLSHWMEKPSQISKGESSISGCVGVRTKSEEVRR